MTSRLQNMLDELDAQLALDRQHEAALRIALEESATWSRLDDREWIQNAAAAATAMRADAERRYADACHIVDRARRAYQVVRPETRPCAECGQPIQPRQLYAVDGPLHIACSHPAGSAR